MTSVIESKTPELRLILEDAIAKSLNDTAFTDSIKQAVRQSLAKTLVQKFGGELEKQVNALKSDPLTRARIVLALDEIVKTKAA